jgi:hypothetical protein
MSRPQSKAAGSLRPITGTYTVPRAQRQKIAASVAFDFAWHNAVEKAADTWGPAADGTKVEVQYRARIDIWNPGGVGWCSVTLIPGGG